jgi:AbrB family looped-hinge helix DNA binding protein
MARRIIRVGNRGQVVIPREIRSSLGIESGSQICARVEDNCIILEVVSEDLVDKTRGLFKGGPSFSAGLAGERQTDEW